MFWLCKAALPRMQKGGAIVNTTSIQAYDPSPSLLAHASTIGTILTFTKALSRDAIKRGIHVNAVAPGSDWTPLIVSTFGPESVPEFGAQTPIGRAGQPVPLASTYVFLASAESTYIVGEVIGATGGKPLARGTGESPRRICGGGQTDTCIDTTSPERSTECFMLPIRRDRRESASPQQPPQLERVASNGLVRSKHLLCHGWSPFIPLPVSA
jgi:Enoyl-(Acyl carrier protein) reductase